MNSNLLQLTSSDMSSKVGQKGSSGPEESPSPATWKKEHGKKKKRKK
jgi:hypothetical protein